MYHLGKVICIYFPNDKNIVAFDKSVQATMLMWDENMVTGDVAESIADKLKVDDIVLVDYNPVPGTGAPKVVIAKILRGKLGKDSMKAYQDFLESKKKPPQQNSISLPFPRQQIT